METVELGWNEFWAELIRVKNRQSIPGIEQYDKMIVQFCIEVLDLGKGDEVLDIACGAGEHSIAFAKAGMVPTGFDIAPRLIEVGTESAKEKKVDVNFFVGDMREINFTQRFQGAVIMSHSFGFFNHEENRLVLQGTYNSLLDGGRLLLDLMNPFNVPRFQKTWTKLNHGYLLSEPHTMDATSGQLRGRPAIFIDISNNRIVQMNEDAMSNNDIRMYSALEIRDLLDDVGFKKIEFYGQNKLPRMPYSSNSERMVVVAER
jgi:ubiquinone/menaquinone biosynthesis C-methylase UbiE